MKNKLNSGYRHLFGPIPSRRLGVSLGVDLFHSKVCTLDCVYCECGKTKNLTVSQNEYVPVDNVIYELKNFLSSAPDIDYITFAGSGEPTLHSCLGDLIRFLKCNYSRYRVAVLTNGTLFYEPDIIKQVLDADLVKVSIDAGSFENFDRINRPHHKLELSKIIDGLIKFRKQYNKELWIEVFIVKNINDTMPELNKIKNIINQIKPDRIHLNTLDRPGTESWVEPVEKSVLTDIAKYLNNAILIDKDEISGKISGNDIEKFIIATVKRRPITAKDVSSILKINENDADKCLNALFKNGQVDKKIMPRGIFYFNRN
ncbi:MAG: radical SAM protein [Proteobacteria bacterium]|nr:radical SAM protein [Pseudomonadota bacterium]